MNGYKKTDKAGDGEPYPILYSLVPGSTKTNAFSVDRLILVEIEEPDRNSK